jgi:hypothetical protein
VSMVDLGTAKTALLGVPPGPCAASSATASSRVIAPSSGRMRTSVKPRLRPYLSTEPKSAMRSPALAAAQKLWFISMLTPAREGSLLSSASVPTTSTMVEMAPPCSAPAQLAVGGGWLLAMNGTAATQSGAVAEGTRVARRNYCSARRSL